MSKDKDFQELVKRLIQAGIITSIDDLKPEAIRVLKELTDEEIECLFSVRQKLSEKSREKYDRVIPPCGF